MWQLAKMPLKELHLDDVSLAFFLKYFHFPGLQRLSWAGMGWCDNPDQLLWFRPHSPASNAGQRLLLANDRARFTEIQYLSVSSPSIPLEKLKLFFQACVSLRRFETRYMSERMDAQYTVADLQRLLDIQAESIRKIALGHILYRNGYSPGDCKDMIDFTRMPQLERLSLNADNVFCLDPEYFAAMICAPRLGYLIIEFESEAQYGVSSRCLQQSTHDWLVRFSTAHSTRGTNSSPKLCLHLDGGLDHPFIDYRTFDSTEELFIRWPYPWDYLEAAKQKLEADGVELTWTTPSDTKEEWQKRLLREWKDRHLSFKERYAHFFFVADDELAEDESSRAESDHDHNPRQRRFCQEFLEQNARRPCVH